MNQTRDDKSTRRFLPPWAIVSVTAMIAVTQMGSSCTSSTPDTNRRPDSYDPYPSNDRRDRDDRERERDRADRDERSSDLPYDARLVAQGTGQLQFTAGSVGRVWVYEAKNRAVVFTDQLLEGDALVMIPAEDKIFINQKTAARLELDNGQTYRLYFDGRRGRSDTSADTNQPKPARKPVVPASSKVMAEARGTDLSFKAPSAGTAYLLDTSTNKLIKTFAVKKNQRLTVSPAQDVVTLDGKVILKQSLGPKIYYRLLFDPADDR